MQCRSTHTLFDFNTHSLTGVIPEKVDNMTEEEKFQYTLPYGSDSDAVIGYSFIINFNTHSLTGVIPKYCSSRPTAEFQYTLPYGSDSLKDRFGEYVLLFQYTLPYGSDS